MNKAYLLLGANEGDSNQYLADASRLIEQNIGRICKASAIYQSAAWGKTDQADFLNQALEVNTFLSATALLSQINNIENKLGRQRSEHWGPRSLDIDIIFYNYDIINKPELQIPHPQMHLRRFVLMPLASIAAQLKHPVLNKTITELLDNCPDDLEVKALENKKV